MGAIAARYTGLSVLLLPGQPLDNIEIPSGVDTLSVTYAAETSTLAQVNATTDMWSGTFTIEGSTLATSSSLVDSWATSWNEQATLLAVQPDIRLDTWSTAFNEQPTSVGGSGIPQDVVDTWSIGIAEIALAAAFDYWTELSPLLLPWAQAAAFTDKSIPSTAQLSGSDVFSLTCTESPTDSVQLDVWDILAIAVQDVATLGVSQSYPALDEWDVAISDISSVTQSGVIPIDTSDTWAATLSAENSALSTNQFATSDTWSASATEGVASIIVTSDQKDTTDTWSAASMFESGSAAVVSAIPILASDEWDINIGEVAGLVIFGAFDKSTDDAWAAAITDDAFLSEVVIQVQPRRRIKVDGTIRRVDVE